MNQNLKASQEKSKQAMVCYYCNFSFVLNITAKNKLLNNQTLNGFFPWSSSIPCHGQLTHMAFLVGFPSTAKSILYDSSAQCVILFFSAHTEMFVRNLALIVKMSRK